MHPFCVSKQKTHCVSFGHFHRDNAILYVCRSKTTKLQWSSVSLMGNRAGRQACPPARTPRSPPKVHIFPCHGEYQWRVRQNKIRGADQETTGNGCHCKELSASH